MTELHFFSNFTSKPVLRTFSVAMTLEV